MVAKSNTPKTPKLEIVSYLVKLHFSIIVGIFRFSPKLHIFNTKRFRLKSPTTLRIWIFKNVPKFQILGGYMVVAPSYHLALVLVKCQLRVNSH
jgi:ABC-type amino acid transport system permease subunit